LKIFEKRQQNETAKTKGNKMKVYK